MDSSQPTSFARKRVLITGASSGVGRATAFKFLNSGAKVAMVGRDIQALNEIGQQFPLQAIAIQCDLGVDLQQYDMSKVVIEKLGGLDILVNAAGVIFDGDIQNTYPQDFDYIIDINVRCPFHLINLFLPFLKLSKGCVVNVSASAGHRPSQGAVSYSVSKAGLQMLTKTVALELAPQGVRVNAVAPTSIDSNFLRYQGLKEDEYLFYKQRKANSIPLKRVALPQEIAKAVIFLASEKTVSVTGHIMNVDGGFSLTTSNFTHWFGSELMNRRFDPTSKNYVEFYLKKFKNQFKKTTTNPEPGTLEWLKAKHKSTWATNLEEAHEKVTDQYEKIEGQEDELSQYVEMHMEGGTENPRLAKKSTVGGGARVRGFI